MTTAKAVTAGEFDRLLRPLLPPVKDGAELRLAVAVSGGADSMALALLVRDWAAKRGASVVALIVDHRLRAESTHEARQVARWLKEAGIACRILTWRDEVKPTANRQAAAREARYRLLRDHCRRHGIGHLLLAHHRDDQAETFLLRALRGSGVDGLAAMPPARQLDDGLLLLRPLLDIPKARLIAVLKTRKQPWIEDPSNADPAHRRVRVRQALRLLAGDDETARAELVTHLAQSARNLSRARLALNDAAYDALRAATVVTPAGFAWLDPWPLRRVADETALRALSRLLMAIGGQALPPRLERLERLWLVLRDEAAGFAAQSLHRCSLRPDRDSGRILVCREMRHLPPPLPLRGGDDLLWDGRFRVAVTKAAPAGLRLAALGGARLPQEETAAAAATVPRAARATLPALWRGNRPIAALYLGMDTWPAGIALAFQPPGAALDWAVLDGAATLQSGPEKAR